MAETNGTSLKRTREDLDEEQNQENNKNRYSIKIENLVRPFTALHLRQELEKYGKIVFFWLSQKKSDCIASFETQDECEKAVQSMDQRKWPDMGKILKVQSIQNNEIEQFIQNLEKNTTSGIADFEEYQKKRFLSQDSRLKITRQGNMTNDDSKNDNVIHFKGKGEQDQEKEAKKPLELNKLFKKTNTLPSIYYQTVDSQIVQQRIQDNYIEKYKKQQLQMNSGNFNKNNQRPLLNKHEDRKHRK